MSITSIKIITENSCIKSDLMGQHGISMLIEQNKETYLFDCGQIAEGLLYNIKNMKIDINKIQGIIISHRDNDHCGSLPKLIKKLKKQPIYITPDMDAKKYAYKNFVVIDKATKLGENIFIIGPISSKKCKEQSIAIDLGKEGLVILVGCSHPGIQKIVDTAKKITGNKKIMGIIGGLHFIEMKEKEIEKEIAYLKSLKMKFILPGHCTGEIAIQKMKKHLGNIVKTSCLGGIGAGSIIQIKPKLIFDINR